MKCLEQLAILSLRGFILFFFFISVSFGSEAVVSKERIKKDIERFLERKYPDIEIVYISVPKIRPIRGESIKTYIKESSKTYSYIYLTYYVYKDTQLLKRFSIPVRYKKVSYVVFSKVAIKRGEYITKDKVILKKFLGNPRHMFLSIDEVVGSKAKINIRENTPLKEYMIEPDYFVKRGSNVKIIYNKGIIHIELIGKALENGKKGQIINVKNLSSGKVIQCRVIGRNQVLFIGGSL